MKLIPILAIVLVCAASPAIAADPQPGEACPANGAVVQTGGPEQIPGRTLICNGTVWKTVAETTTAGRSLFQIDNDTGPCNADKAGRMRYVQAGTPPWQFCDGTNWVNFKQPQCTDDATGECYLATARSASDAQFVSANIASGVNILGVTGTLTGGLSGPSGCEDIGDLCADGTVFAGYHPITQEHLFIPTTDQSAGSNWKTSTGTNDIATDSTWDGRANTNQVANSATFPAFKLCKDLTVGGHNDWYLPSQIEFYYIWSVHQTIEAGGNITSFQNTLYWTSTEYAASNPFYQNLANGVQYNNSAKNTAYDVRCVRR